jgi:hypothetical protein
MNVVLGYPPKLYSSLCTTDATCAHSKMHVRRVIRLLSTATAYRTKAHLPSEEYPNHDIRMPLWDTWQSRVNQGSRRLLPSNISDTNRRCSNITQELEQSTEDLWKCHDASDDIQRASQYMTPLRTVPLPGLLDTGTATISVPHARQRQFVRIFQ